MKRRHKIAVFQTTAFIFCACAVSHAQNPQDPAGVVAKQRQVQRNPRQGAAEDPVGVYVVKRGDTLYRIARAHGTTVADLKSANRLRSNTLKIGQRLRISDSDPAAQAVSSKLSNGTGGSTEEGGGPKTAEVSGGESPVADASSQAPRFRLVKAGFDLLGVRYRWQGTSERSGFDCSGFVKSLFGKFNIDLPRSSREQFKLGEKVDKAGLEAGDLVFFGSRGKTPSHVGVYIGDDQFVHAARQARQVIVSSLSKAWYSKRFLGGRRILDLWLEESESHDTQDK